MAILIERNGSTHRGFARALRVTLGVPAFALMLMMAADAATGGREPVSVYTVNYPLAYFAERIGGDYVRVTFPAPPTGDPAGWSPSAEDIADYQRADLILLNGAGYADWTQKAALPENKLVNTSAGFADAYVSESAATHSHGRGSEHSHEAETAFTTWLDPQLAISQAAAIRDALSAMQPESADDFDVGYASLQGDLQELDADFAAVFRRLGDAPVVFSHPVYQYLERRYDVNGVSVHWEPDEVPGEKDFIKLSETLMRHPAEIMIWEGKPEPESVEALAAWTIDSAVLNPCGNRPAQGDYLTVMRENVANINAVIAD